MITALSFAPVAFALNPDGPEQVSRPQFTVVAGADHNVLQFNGSTAQTLFGHLNDPHVRRFNSEFFQFKMGFGLVCVTALQNYSCWEKLSSEGEVEGYFPYTEMLKTSAPLRLILKGPAMEELYTRMSENGGAIENGDGSIALIKQRTAITCTKLIQPTGSASFDCSQDLFASGYPIGTGTDPMIGSGTRPVTLEVEEGVN
jgi:hypothetical protein